MREVLKKSVNGCHIQLNGVWGFWGFGVSWMAQQL